MRIKLLRVHYMPKTLAPGVLYVSEEFGAAAHLCACGCGAKVRTPLGPTAWSLEESRSGVPTLRPSVGNWQLPCRSHYLINNGEVVWAESWSSEKISTGRRAEEERRSAYYDAHNQQHLGVFQRFWHLIARLFK